MNWTKFDILSQYKPWEYKFLSLIKSICKRTSTLNIIFQGEILSKPRMSALTISFQHCSIGHNHTSSQEKKHKD